MGKNLNIALGEVLLPQLLLRLIQRGKLHHKRVIPRVAVLCA